jgi:hypothetical protein
VVMGTDWTGSCQSKLKELVAIDNDCIGN